MPKNYYLSQLYKHTDQPTLTFAFRGTIHWMRALAIVCEKKISDESVKEFYKDVQIRKENDILDLKVFENILMAIHNLHSLQSINKSMQNPYDVVRTQVVNWYYSIYYTSSAMCAAKSGSVSETHTGTSKIFQNDLIDSCLIMSPFDLSVNTLVEKDYKKYISDLRDGNKFDLNTLPTAIDESYGCLYSYLQGTARYKKWQAEEELFKSKEFKNLDVENFRTKAARELRDTKLKKGFVNFLTQAFRYRGKAHYRDSVFLSYGSDNSQKVEQFLKDLEVVGMSFFKMASLYCSQRIKKTSWESYVEDLQENLLFEFDMSVLECG